MCGTRRRSSCSTRASANSTATEYPPHRGAGNAPLFSCGQRSNMPPKSPEKSPDFAPKNTNGNKACACLDTSRRQSCRGRLRRPRHPLAALAGAETSTRLHNQSNPSTNQGSRKRFAKQRFFGKRSRNRTKRAGCLGKLPEKRGLRRRRRGGQGAPLTRLRCPVVPAARKLVFMPSLAFNFRGRHPSSWQYAPYLSAHSGTEEQ